MSRPCIVFETLRNFGSEDTATTAAHSSGGRANSIVSSIAPYISASRIKVLFIHLYILLP